MAVRIVLLAIACLCALPYGSQGRMLQNVPTLASFAKANNLTTLAAALDAVNFTAPTTKTTIFAPTDQAFTALLSQAKVTAAQLLANKTKLGEVLTYHVVPKAYIMAKDIPASVSVPTLNAKAGNLTVTNAKGMVMVNNATVVKPDVLYKPGEIVIHVIDRVLVPKGVTLP